MNTEDLRAYHKHISETYDKRSGNHDQGEWHRKTALRLIAELPPRSGDSVLDIGTGTGTIAFHAASLIGPIGKVIGVDISKGMLVEANKKLDTHWDASPLRAWRPLLRSLCVKMGRIYDESYWCLTPDFYY